MKVRVPVLLAVAALLLLAVVVAGGRSGIPIGFPDLTAARSRARLSDKPLLPTSNAASEPVAYGLGLVIVFVVIAALISFACLLFALSGIRFYRRRKVLMASVLEDEPMGLNAPWLGRATRRAMSEMDRKMGGPPSDAVIAAWIELERAAAASGVGRAPHQTPSEFTASVLAECATDAVALRELRTLYHRARFGSPNSVTAEDAAAARRALERIALEVP